MNSPKNRNIYHTNVMPVSALQAVVNRVGDIISIWLGRKAPGQLDEAGGDQGGHDISGAVGVGPALLLEPGIRWSVVERVSEVGGDVGMDTSLRADSGMV